MNSTVHPSNRSGVRFVLVNPSDPTRLDEFSAWYDSYSSAITAAGALANDVYFENPAAVGDKTDPRFAAVYDIVSSDPATAWPDTEISPVYPTQLFTDPRAKLVSPALAASYALVGSQSRSGRHSSITGIHVLLSNGGDDIERRDREAQILEGGMFCSTTRFRLIEGSPEPAEWLEIFETDDPNPLNAHSQATSHMQPISGRIETTLSESFRMAG
jgi:hypothetical protein